MPVLEMLMQTDFIYCDEVIMMENTVYHYCSTDIFQKIVTAKTIRMSDITKSNDSMEIRWIARNIRNAFDHNWDHAYDNAFNAKGIDINDNVPQLTKDITNIKKEPKTDETNHANERTSRAREEAVDELLSFVVDQIGRSLSSIERRVLVRWVEQGTDLEMIRIALQDNLYRKEWFDLRYTVRYRFVIPINNLI